VNRLILAVYLLVLFAGVFQLFHAETKVASNADAIAALKDERVNKGIPALASLNDRLDDLTARVNALENKE
jgi:hypothetical protein